MNATNPRARGAVPPERTGGRGTVDMKGGVAAQICAMIALKRAGVAIDGELVLTGVIPS